MMKLKALRPLPKWQVALIVIFSFFVIFEFTSDISRDIVQALAGDATPLRRFLILTPVYSIRMIIIPVIITAFLVGRKETLRVFGFRQSMWRGLGFAFVVVLPLPIAYAFTTPLRDPSIMLVEILRDAVFFGAAEEILFRCFLFGLLFRLAGWGFLPAAMLGAIIFGIGHLYQGNAFLDSASVFAITLIAALWWAWIYVEWNYNAWVPIGLHVFMNGWFNVFQVSESALLPIAGEVARALVVILSIVLTIVMSRKNGGLKITGKLWFKSGDLQTSK